MMHRSDGLTPLLGKSWQDFSYKYKWVMLLQLLCQDQVPGLVFVAITMLY